MLREFSIRPDKAIEASMPDLVEVDKESSKCQRNDFIAPYEENINMGDIEN